MRPREKASPWPCSLRPYMSASNHPSQALSYAAPLVPTLPAHAHAIGWAAPSRGCRMQPWNWVSSLWGLFHNSVRSFSASNILLNRKGNTQCLLYMLLSLSKISRASFHTLQASPPTSHSLSVRSVSPCSLCSLHLATSLHCKHVWFSTIRRKTTSHNSLWSWRALYPLSLSPLPCTGSLTPSAFTESAPRVLLALLSETVWFCPPPLCWHSPLKGLLALLVVKPSGHFRPLPCMPSDNREPFAIPITYSAFPQ